MYDKSGERSSGWRGRHWSADAKVALKTDTGGEEAALPCIAVLDTLHCNRGTTAGTQQSPVSLTLRESGQSFAQYQVGASAVQWDNVS
jgi:hypothetical protein